ncbi:hypothetical protein [Micromonospora musae]
MSVLVFGATGQLGRLLLTAPPTGHAVITTDGLTRSRGPRL